MPLPNDMQRTSEQLARVAAADNGYTADPKKSARNLIRPTLQLVKPTADAMAADNTAYTAAYQVVAPRAGRLLGMKLQPQGALAANAADFVTARGIKADGLGGAPTTLASLVSDIAGGSWVAGVTKTFTLTATAADLRFNAGQVIGFTLTKSGAGVVVPAFVASLDIEWEGIDAYPV